MKKLISSFFFIIICFAAHAQAGNNDAKTEVMMRMLKLKKSLTGKDSAGLADVLGDDVSYGHSNGLLQTKAQLIHDVVTKVQDYQSIDPTDMVIRLYENTAIVTIKAKVNMLMKGKPLELSMNVLLVWVKISNVWKLEARQAVKNNQ